MKQSLGGKVFDTINLFLMLFFCLTIIYPIYTIVLNSFSTEADILRSGFRIFPSELYLENWQKIVNANLIWQSFFNTVFITVCASFYSLFLSATYAYPLSRKYLPNRNFWTFILVFTMFFSGGLIPYYLLMRDLGLVNTR
jgi:putative aldouronate transport system permease protein